MDDDLRDSMQQFDGVLAELAEVVQELVAELGCEHKTLPAASALIQ